MARRTRELCFPETVGRGHLSEVTIGLHMKGELPASSTTPPNSTGRWVRSAHPHTCVGRLCQHREKRFPRLPCRRGSLSKATTPPERKIRRDVTGIHLTRSILLIMKVRLRRPGRPPEPGAVPSRRRRRPHQEMEAQTGLRRLLAGHFK